MTGKLAKIAILTWVLSVSLNLFPNSLAAKTVEVLPNIFTIVHGDGVDSNTTFIITQEGVIVIDTRVSPLEAEKVMAEIRQRTDLPVVYTINTHYHGDHTFGNQVFSDSKAIVAHKNVWRSLTGPSSKDHLEKFKARNLPGLDAVKITPPNLLFDNGMEIYLGGYHLQLIHRGRGHTDGDTYIYLNELRTVITGDLVFSGQFPYIGDGYIDEWIDVLQYMENQDNELVIPGHGNVGGKPLIIATKHYLISLKELVFKQVKEGKSLKETLEAARPVLLEKYKSWEKPERLDGNIERAFLEYSTKEKL